MGMPCLPLGHAGSLGSAQRLILAFVSVYPFI